MKLLKFAAVALVTIAAQVASAQSSVCFFTGVNYSGDRYCYSAGTRVGSLPSYLNNSFASVALYGDVEVRAHDNSELGTTRHYATIRRSLSNLDSVSLNRRISSFIVYGSDSGYNPEPPPYYPPGHGGGGYYPPPHGGLDPYDPGHGGGYYPPPVHESYRIYARGKCGLFRNGQFVRPVPYSYCDSNYGNGGNGGYYRPPVGGVGPVGTY